MNLMEERQEEMRQALARYFGFSEFRPLQAEIMADALAGRDVLALLPTGGGKSLCFQLPALLREGLTVVVSPLIALMKDQVDALSAAGVPATFLNSSLSGAESAERARALGAGRVRLLYVAPERLLMSGFVEELAGWKVAAFAIDEAHCVSEWGHDFRPEYRQLARLRERFPDLPWMALTATATERVRSDIVVQLALRSPAVYVASFNRPNLTYRVAPKQGAYEQIVQFLRKRPQESGIVYCQSRRTAEELAGRLRSDGFAAGSYHAGMEGGDRTRTQEAFLRDEVRVVCATIAFGMGINKPNVRFVIHHDLPKNVESYYQETGRAGRDGLPAECLLLFSPGDRMKHLRFIEEKPDPTEQKVAKDQLEQIVHYAEDSGCRRVRLLGYFGEVFEAEECGGCDNCLAPRQAWDGTTAAQKFLSCVHRIRERSGFATGIQHVVEVLCGADTEKVRSWGHDTLSTYGIGKEHSRSDWAGIGRELVRLGFLRQDAARFNVVEITAEGRSVLRERRSVALTRAIGGVGKTVGSRAGEIECDEGLFDRLRTLRKRLADAQGVPSYIVFSDVSIRWMARTYPETLETFARISGVGAKKLQDYGELFVVEIRAYLGENTRQRFEDAPAAGARGRGGERTVLTPTARVTLEMHRQGRLVDEIAAERGFVRGTILGHLALALEVGESVRVQELIDPAVEPEIAAAFERHGYGNLTGVHESLGGRVDHGTLRVWRASRQAARAAPADGRRGA